MGQSKYGARVAKAALRREEILRRRADGLTYAQLAEEFKISVRRVQALLMDEFERLSERRADTAEQLVTRSLARYDALLDAVWDQAVEGDLEAVKVATSLVEKQTRLLGLQKEEAAAKVAVLVGAGNLEDHARRLGVTLEALRGPPIPVLDYSGSESSSDSPA